MAKRPTPPCDHQWTYHTPPIGPDWQQCRRCEEVRVECMHCFNKAMPPNVFKCPDTRCGRRRAHNRLLMSWAI